MSAAPGPSLQFRRGRKLTLRGHGSFVGGTTNDIPPPPIRSNRGANHFLRILGI